MSWEAWGGGDEESYDHLLEAGWWNSEQVEKVVEAIQLLASTTLYEGGQKGKGISVEFLMRLTLLKDAASLDVPKPLLDEATAYFERKGSPI